MPSPFRIYTFSKQFDGRYILNINMQNAKDRIFGSIFEQISKNIDQSIMSLESLEETGWLVFGNIRITANNKDVCLSYVFNATLEDDENIAKIPINELVRLARKWQNLQKAQCEIINIALLDMDYRIEGFYKETYEEEARIDKDVVVKKMQTVWKSKPILEEKEMEIIEALLVNYLCRYPGEADMWLRLTMLEQKCPWEDPYRMSNYLENALLHEQKNIYAVIILAYIEWLFFGGVNLSTFTALHNLETHNPELLSMIEYVKSFYYDAIDFNDTKHKDYEGHLLKSIEHFNKYVHNFQALATYYAKKGDFDKAIAFAEQALENIQVIYSEIASPEGYDLTDVEEFLDEFIRGTHKPIGGKERIEEFIKEIELKQKKVMQ